MTNSLTIHQHNLFQPARRRGNSPFRAPPLAASQNVSIERRAAVPIESRWVRGERSGQRRHRGGREGAAPRCAEPGSSARRHANWISFTRGGGKAQGLGRLGRFIQGFIDKKKKKKESGQQAAGSAHAHGAARTHTYTHTYTHTHTQPLLPPVAPPPGAGEARGGCVIHFPGAGGDKLCGVAGPQPDRTPL